MSFCSNCGAQLQDGSTFCPNCGHKVTEQSTSSISPADATRTADQTGHQSEKQPCPKTYLAFSILTTLLCCLPFGIIGIVKSAQVSSRYNEGNYTEALKASKDAKKWSLIALICGLASIAIYVIVIVATVLIDSM